MDAYKIYRINQKNYMRITYKLLNKCNFNCYFCDHSINDKMASKDDVDQFILQVKQIRTLTDRQLFIWIYGGEPSIHPDIFYLIEELNKIDNLLIKIDTNLGGFIGKEEQLNKLNENLEISWSIQSQTFNNFDKYYQSYLKLTGNKDCKVLVDHNNWDFVMSMINDPKIKERFWLRDIIHSESKLSDDQMTFIDEHNTQYDIYKKGVYEAKLGYYIEYQDGTKKHMNINELPRNYKNLLCSSGYDGFFIDFDNSVYTCHAHWFNFTRNKKTPPLFNLNECTEENIKNLIFKYKLCRWNYCVCELSHTKKTLNWKE